MQNKEAVHTILENVFRFQDAQHFQKQQLQNAKQFHINVFQMVSNALI